MYSQLTFFCVFIALASLFGGSLPALVRLTHRRIQLTLSFVSGVMLGVALLALLPHSIQMLGSADAALTTCLAGLLFMFFMVRMFHFHQHDLAFEDQHDHKQKELCDHDHDQHHVHCNHHDGAVDFSWVGLCFGLAVHTIIDGIALAAATQTNAPIGYSIGGTGVFLAILLHKPLDALSITSLMSAKGWSKSKQLIVNLIFCLMCPLGALVFALSIEQFVDIRAGVLGVALAFSAGIFLCISLGDILPEVHFHSHDRVQLSIMLLMGVLLAFVIELGHGHSVPAIDSVQENAAAVGE
jgi:zinc and cadmium transporter